jgi:hypothetical protein
MNKSFFGEGMKGSSGRDARLARTRNAHQEMARILGGIGAPLDPLPLLEPAEAVRKSAIAEWLP